MLSSAGSSSDARFVPTKTPERVVGGQQLPTAE
jgi:hypothetical protein